MALLMPQFLTSGLQTERVCISVVLGHHICGNLLQQANYETNTDVFPDSPYFSPFALRLPYQIMGIGSRTICKTDSEILSISAGSDAVSLNLNHTMCLSFLFP